MRTLAFAAVAAMLSVSSFAADEGLVYETGFDTSDGVRGLEWGDTSIAVVIFKGDKKHEQT